MKVGKRHIGFVRHRHATQLELGCRHFLVQPRLSDWLEITFTDFIHGDVRAVPAPALRRNKTAIEPWYAHV
jgi:hypothetical protein